MLLKWILNLYPPYWGTGIVIQKITKDFKEITVQMKKRWYNRNYVNTHFGGSLYSMTDPFFMLMLIQNLGEDYIVWDKSANIDFVKPGIGTVTAEFLITDDHLKTIREKTADGKKYFQEFQVSIRNEDDTLVAKSTKIVYIRKKHQKNKT